MAWLYRKVISRCLKEHRLKSSFQAAALSHQEQEEFDSWEQASDEAWGLIEQWEREEGP